MKNIKYNFDMYFYMIAQSIKSKMIFKLDFYISVIGIIVINLSGFISLWIIFQNFKGEHSFEDFSKRATRKMKTETEVIPVAGMTAIEYYYKKYRKSEMVIRD